MAGNGKFTSLREMKKIFDIFNIKYFYLAFFHFAVSFFTDKLVFEYDKTDLFILLKTKFIFLIFLVVFWQIVSYIISNYKSNVHIRQTVKFSAIYFAVMMFFELLLWPVVVADQMYYGYMKDTVTLNNLSSFAGYFIYYFRIIALMLIPHFSAFVIVQNIAISFIIGYIIAKFYKYFKNSKFTCFLFLPFLMPLVIEYNLYMEKDILFSYLVMLLFVKLAFIKIENSINKRNLFMTALVTSFVSALRPDGIFFLAFPLLFFLIDIKTFRFKNFAVFFVFLLVCMSIFMPNYADTVILNKNGKSYHNAYFLNNSFKALLNQAINDKSEILNEFNRDTDLTVKFLLSDKIRLTDGFFTKLPERDKKKLEIIAKKLISRYKYEYADFKIKRLKKMWFADIKNADVWVPQSPSCLQSLRFVEDKITLINSKIYSAMIKLFKDYTRRLPHAKIHVLSVPLIFLFITSIILLFLRRAELSFLPLFIIVYNIVLVVIAPYPMFRYYFSIYLIGYLLSALWIIFLFYKIGEKKFLIRKKISDFKIFKEICAIFDKKYFYLAFFHFAVSFFTDRLIFEYSQADLFSFLRIKFGFFLVLVVLWQFIGNIVKLYKTNVQIKSAVKFSAVYFIIMMFFELLLWPVIVGDQMYYIYMKDTLTLTNTAAFSGYFMFYFRIVSLMLIPHFSGLIITQILAISAVTGYIISKFYIYSKKSDFVWLLYIPLLFPVVIEYNLQMEKDVIFSYCILLLAFKLIFLKTDMNLTKKNLLMTALVTSFVSALRPDGIMFIALPVLFFLINAKTLGFKNVAVFYIFLALTSTVFFPNYVSTVIMDENGKSYKNSYILNDTFKRLLSRAVKEDNRNILDEFEYDTKLTIDFLLSEQTGLHDGFYTGLNRFDKEKFTKIGNKLISEYKYEYLRCQFEKFKHIVFIDLHRADLAINLNPYCYECFMFVKNKICLINSEIYSKTIRFFDYKNHYYRNFHVLLVPLLMLFCSVFVSGFLRKKDIFFVSFFMIFYTAVLITVFPYPLFRTFFYIYLFGYFLAVVWFLSFICKIKNGTMLLK